MAKEKKQIEYDPSLSEEKRFQKLITDLWSRFWIVVVRVIFVGLIALIIFGIVSSYFDKDFFEDEDGSGIMGMCVCLVFFALGNGMMNYTELVVSRLKKSRGVLNGCPSFGILYSTMPLTRKTVHKTSFRSFMIWTVLPVVTFNVVLNVLAMIVEGFQSLLGIVGLATLISLAALVIFSVLCFGVYKSTEKTERIRTIVFWVLYAVFMGSFMFSGFYQWCNGVGILKALAGIPAIVLTVAVAVFILLREKLVYEKKLTFAAWFD